METILHVDLLLCTLCDTTFRAKHVVDFILDAQAHIADTSFCIEHILAIISCLAQAKEMFCDQHRVKVFLVSKSVQQQIKRIVNSNIVILYTILFLRFCDHKFFRNTFR